MKIRKIYYVLFALIVLIAALILGQKPISPLPDREIAIIVQENNGVQNLVFLHPDGSGLIKVENYRPANSVKWSPSGSSLGIRERLSFPTTAGNPILIDQDGLFVRCPDFRESGYGMGFLSETSVGLIVEEGLTELIVDYDLRNCTRGEVIYQSQAYEEISGFDLSSQGWLAVVVRNSTTFTLKIYNQNGTLEAEISQVIVPSWSKDGERIAYQNYPADRECQTVVSDKYLQEKQDYDTKRATCSSFYAWSPDGSEILYSDGGAIMKLNLETKQQMVFYEDGLYATWR